MKKKNKVKIQGVEFSVRELMIMQELKKGSTYQEIANYLSLSVKTIEYHVKNMKEKTKTGSKEELLAFFDESVILEQWKRIEKKGSDLINNKEFLWKLIIFLVLVVGVMVIIYPAKKENKKVSNILSFSENFLNRSYLENKIVQKLKEQKGIKKVVICGTGGAGKTAISRKFLNESKKDVKFELNAETDETLRNSFLELADQLAGTKNQKKELEIIRNLQDSSYVKKSLVRFVSELLKQSGVWILLIDNVSSFENIKEYFPTNEKTWGDGSILITTRNQNLAENNFIKRDWIVDIGKLSDQEKNELFSKIVYGQRFVFLDSEKKKEVSKFLKKIPEFPLDVCAVAYYIKNTKISFDEYEKAVKESLKDFTNEQREILRENASYSETRYGIVNSALKRIVQGRKDHQILLTILSFMDSQRIPKYIFKEASGIISTDSFIYSLKRHSLIKDTGSDISVHRSTHAIGLSYVLDTLQDNELVSNIHALTKILCKKVKREPKLIPHLKSILAKLAKIKKSELVSDQAELLIVLSDILRNHSYQMNDALQCLKQVELMNNNHKCLNEYKSALVKLRIGEIYTIMNKNIEAETYLSSSLRSFSNNNTVERARNYRLLGIARMRQHKFQEANECFSSGLAVLKENPDVDKLQTHLSESNIYEDMSFNYFLDGINREKAKKAVLLMKKAIWILEDETIKNNEEAISRRAVHKIKLAGIYNALADYKEALKISKETEDLLEESGVYNTDILYVRGLIARERGLSNLRLNNVAKAYDYFEQAREILEKIQKGDYLFKIKNHEIECLIRMNRLDSAMKWCESILGEQERERTNYSDLFYNTSLYHAAIIKYKQKDYEASKKYFQKFFLEMKEFCKRILSQDSYNSLVNQKAFCDAPKTMEEYFKNSLKVFEKIYWRNHEFTECYVRKNISLVKLIHKKT